MIWNGLSNYKDGALLASRVIIGLAFMWVHGSGKIFGGVEKWEKIGGAMANFGLDFLPAFWGFMAAFAEFAGGFLIIVGLLTRPAALLIIITMIVAASKNIFSARPISDIAYPVEMLPILIVLFFIGPGRYSLDFLFNRGERKKEAA